MDFRTITIRLAAVAGLLLGLLLVSTVMAATSNQDGDLATCYVDGTNGSDANSGAAPGEAKATINACVTTTSPGGQVFVASGTYFEVVQVDKALTITGAPDTCGPAADAPVLDGVTQPPFSNNNAFIIAAGTSDVTIEGFVMQNYNTTASFSGAGVNAWNSGTSNITVQHNAMSTVKAMIYVGNSNGEGQHDNWTIDCNTGTNLTAAGIWVGNIDTANITNNNITSGVNSIVVDARGEDAAIGTTDVTIRSNTLNRATADSINIFPISFTVAQVIQNVTIDDNTITPAPQAKAIFVSLFAEAVVRDLTITGNSITISDKLGGVPAVDLRSVSGSSSFSGNTISLEGPQGGVAIGNGVDLVGPHPGDWTFSENTISGGQDITSAGLFLDGSYSGTVEATFNVFENFRFGVRASQLPGTADVTINRNDLANNTNGLENNIAGATIDGLCNWWGDASGPSGQGPGSGSSVSVNVIADSWLLSDDLMDGVCASGEVLPPIMTPQCSDDPTNLREWLISNPNDFELALTWQVDGLGDTEALVIEANDTVSFTAPATDGDNLLQLFLEGQLIASETASDEVCTYPLDVTKTVISNDNPLINPDQAFEICATGVGDGQQTCTTFNLDGGTQTLDLEAGSYTISETNPGSLWTVSGGTTVVLSEDNGGASVEITNTAPSFAPPGITPQCVETPGTLEWLIVNPNAYDLPLTWLIDGTAQTDNVNLAAAGTLTLFTDATAGDDTLRLFVGQTEVAAASHPETPCSFTLDITKQVITNDNPLTSGAQFEICVSGPTSQCATFGLGGGTQTLNLPAGEYTVSETDPGSLWTVSGETTITLDENTPTAAVTITNEAAAYQALSVTALCSNSPGQTYRWQVNNPNPYGVPFNWAIAGGPSGSGDAPTQNSAIFETAVTTPQDVLTVDVAGVIQGSATASSEPCTAPTYPLEIRKQVDDGGFDIDQNFEICYSGPVSDCVTFGRFGGARTVNLPAGQYTVTETFPGADWTVQGGTQVITLTPAGAIVTVVNRYTPQQVSCPAPLGLSGSPSEVDAGQVVVIQAGLPGQYDGIVQRVSFRVIHQDTGRQIASYTDDFAPYYLFGDNGGVPNGWDTTTFPAGQYVVTAEAFTGADQSCGSAQSFTFVTRQVFEPGLSCERGQRIDLVPFTATLRATSPQSTSAGLTLPGAADPSSYIIVQSRVGHPELGCPGVMHPFCGQDQPFETFNILANGTGVGNVPDHGTDQWQAFTFPLTLGEGQHNIDFVHAAIGQPDVQSVSFKAAYCYVPAPPPPADEPPADEAPADEPPADEPPADEPPADEPPADEPPADNAP